MNSDGQAPRTEKDQEPAIAFLSDPASYEPPVASIETIVTHISRLFVAGDRVYKLKRAVALPYVDFRSAEARRRACEAELVLNRRTAPELYLSMRGIGRAADGTVGWASGGEAACDWVVEMRRFEERDLLDRMAEQELLTEKLILDLVAQIGAFHASAEPQPAYGGAAAMTAIARENDSCLRAASPAFFAPDRAAALDALIREELARTAALLDRRRAAGKVRRCHGDLHLRNICLVGGKPTLFDCIEFSEELANIDVLYDLAFLLMDLQQRELGGLANLALNRYLDLTGEDDGLAAMPLFLALRAGIRAHVTALATGAKQPPLPADIAQARRYFDLAAAFLKPAPARLIAIGGPSGTGKSTVTRRLAPLLGAPPGARIIRSDVLRKVLIGVSPETRLPATAYSREMTVKVYDTIGAKAEVALRAGFATIIDAVALQPSERRVFRELADRVGAPFTGIWLTAPREVLLERVVSRRNDASDASDEVVRVQLAADHGPMEWVCVDASGSTAETAAAVASALGIAGGS